MDRESNDLRLSWQHLADNCFRKIGYPWWWGDMPRLKGPNTHQGVLNHPNSERRVPGNTASTRQVNHVSTSNPLASANTTITEADRVGFTRLNDQQWKILVSLMNKRNTGMCVRLSGKYFLES